MGAAKRLAAAGLILLLLYTAETAGAFSSLRERLEQRSGEMRMKNVRVELPEAAEALSVPAESGAGESSEPESSPAFSESCGPDAPEQDSGPEGEVLQSVMETLWREEILETTIGGGLAIKNETDYEIDPAALSAPRPPLRLPSEGPQLLIIHTHGSEAYTQAGLDHYEENDDHRTGDREFNIIRIGDELTDILTEAGLRVIHDREIYDYPSYTGSYSRSGEAVQEYLRQYPDISAVLDIHRDALGSGGVCYKTMAEEQGVCASQIMLLTGSDASGLSHPGWRDNLAFALYLQNAAVSRHPSLMRPVALVRERYNLHLTPGSLIIEVGSSGNTLQEALAAIRLFGRAVAPALLELSE